MGCLTETAIRESLTIIAGSSTDSAEYLRYLAAKALHCGVQPVNLAEALECISLLNVGAGPARTASQMLTDNTNFSMPRIYLHGSGKIAFSWCSSPEVEIILIIGEHWFEMFKVHKNIVIVHRARVGYSGGLLDEGVAKYIPIRIVAELVKE